MARKTKQNSITSPELLAQVNPKNMHLLEEYEAYMQSVQRSEKTIAGYHSDLLIFFVWLLQNAENKFFVDITKRDIIKFQAYLVARNENSPARVRRLKSTISALSNYIENLCDDLYPDFRNIVRKVESPPNEPTREKTVFTDEQLQSLLDALTEKRQYQKACAVALAMCSGARKSELTRFKTWFFDDRYIMYGSLYKTPEKIKTKGRGANGKMLNKYVLAKEFKPYFDAWVKQREELGIDSEWLLVSRDSDGQWAQMKPETLNSWAITFTEMMGVDYYWHSLRHYFTTHLSTKLNIPDAVIKDLVGWSTIGLVEVYKDVDSDEEIGKYFNEDEARPEPAF